MRFSRTTTVLAGATILALSGGVGAFAAGQITTQDIKNDTILSRDIHNGGVGYRDLNAYTQDKIGSKSTVTSDQKQATAVVKYIGGSFSDPNRGATTVDSFTLPAGTYQLTSNGFFESNAPTSGMSQLELALRDGKDDLGTCFTGTASPVKGRDISCSTTRVVTLDQATTIDVKAFGYSNDQGSTDDGKFGVQSTVDILRLS